MAALWTSLGTSVPTVVMTLIGDQFRLYGRILPHTTDLVTDLGAEDDMEIIEIVMTMEEVFDVRFRADAVRLMRTVGDVVLAVEQALALQQTSNAMPDEDDEP